MLRVKFYRNNAATPYRMNGINAGEKGYFFMNFKDHSEVAKYIYDRVTFVSKNSICLSEHQPNITEEDRKLIFKKLRAMTSHSGYRNSENRYHVRAKKTAKKNATKTYPIGHKRPNHKKCNDYWDW